MNGERLHEFDLQLIEYALSNVRSHAALAKPYMDPAVFAYMMALDGDDEPPPLLLTDQDFDDLADTVEEASLYEPWEPYEALHRRSITCVAEIRAALAPRYAEEWARASRMLTKRLERDATKLSEGIAAVHEWVRAARRLLRAMGATQFLPRPEGRFPTPVSPEPPPALPHEDMAATQERSEDDALMTAVGEILDLLRTQRTIKDYHTTAEVATMLGKVEYTVREWCRNGRVRCQKQGSGRGKYQAWVISHEALQRIQKEGLLPAQRPTYSRHAR